MRRAALLVCLVACADAPPPAGVTYLTPVEHLSRASLALRGVRPGIEELAAVDRDPAQLPAIVDRYLASDEFGETVRDLHNEVLLVRFQLEDFVLPPVGALAPHSENAMRESVFEEPLRLIEDVVVSDQPYSRIVTADYMMADPIVAKVWGLEHSGSPGWERTPRVDPTGPIGILGSTAIFLRYRSVANNYNRGRANALARSLICHDFLDAEIHLDPSVNLADREVVRTAVIDNPTCAGCHQDLDPLASYFFGYLNGVQPFESVEEYPIDWYHNQQHWNPAFRDTWIGTNNRPPSYFGREVFGLDGLAAAISNDPRFARCAVQHFASYLTEQRMKDLSRTWVAELHEQFVADGLSAKKLARAIVLSDLFRTAAIDDPAEAERVIGYQKVRPEQLRRMLLDLTGFAWRGETEAGPFDHLADDRDGFRVLAGGIDSYYVTQPVHTMNVTASLVARRAAALAAETVVAHDGSAALAERRLFTEVDTTDEALVRSQLVVLHARIYGELVTADAPSIDETYTLYAGALAANNDARRAWVVTLTGMLSDLRALYY